MKLHEFSTVHPKTWFTYFENAVKGRNITEERDLYYLLFEHLPIETIAEIEGQIALTPTYRLLKQALIDKYAVPQKENLRKLFRGVAIEDRSPSQLLRHIQSLIGPYHMDEELVKQMWMDQLPPSVKTFMAVSIDDSLQRLATVADRVYECHTSTTTHNAISRGDIRQLSSQMTKECTLADNDKYKSRHQTRSHSRSRRRSRSKSKAVGPNGICWYHQTFGNKARKCVMPCSYKKPVDPLNFQASC